MIGLSAGTKIWIVCGVTDMRKGFDGLIRIVFIEPVFDGPQLQLTVFYLMDAA